MKFGMPLSLAARRTRTRLRPTASPARSDGDLGGRDRQSIGPLVQGVADVALDPVPAHVLVAGVAASSASQSSLFLTGSPEAVFQPLRFQPAIHEVMPSWR